MHEGVGAERLWGLPCRLASIRKATLGDVVCVSSVGDITFAQRRWARGIYLNHGIGQTYFERDRVYDPGAGKPSWVKLFLAPNRRTAERLAAGSSAEVVVVGQPKLDRWVGHEPQGKVVALSWRWRQNLCPESGTVFDHYAASLADLRLELEADGIELIGHSHPRIWPEARRAYLWAGIEPVENFSDVLARATVYVCDNSSTMFEWAALDRPVVVLNGPPYRRDVDHGGRFWEWADIGVQVDQPADLPTAIRTALQDPSSIRDARRQISAEVLVADGNATARAVRAIHAHLSAH